MTNHKNTRRPTHTGWSCRVQVKQISNKSLLASHSYQHSQQQQQQQQKDVMRSASSLARLSPVSGGARSRLQSVRLWALSWDLSFISTFGLLVPSALQSLTSLKTCFSRIFQNTIVVKKKGLICHFHLQHTNLMVMYMQAKRDPNYCAVLMNI